jgi:transcriptional regulator with XRE-family HTH domain
MRAVQLTQDRWAEARRLREALGLSLREIAARFGVHPSTMRKRAAVEGWASPSVSAPAASSNTPALSGDALSVVGRRELIQRLYKAMDTKLKLMERRMEAQMTNLDKGEDLPSADHERDTRAFGAMIKNIEQVKEMQADLDRVAGGQPATAADAELFAEAERFRREIAERLARFIPPAR